MNFICISPVDLGPFLEYIRCRRFGYYQNAIPAFIKGQFVPCSKQTLTKYMDMALAFYGDIPYTKCLDQNRQRLYVLGDGVIQLHYKGTGKLVDNGLRLGHAKWTYCGVLR